jgi:glycosyltransferase involved in cell wall biosynthesis
MEVSTVARDDAASADSIAMHRIDRQSFPASSAKLFLNQMRWGKWLTRRCNSGIDVIHCGEIRPVGYSVWWAHKRSKLPYVIYVNGGDLLRERVKTAQNPSKRWTARRIFGDAAAIVANSAWSESVTRDLLQSLEITIPPPIAAIDLGTDPAQFHPTRDTRALRARWGIGDESVMLTVARLVPHKGQDVAISTLAALSSEFPNLHYVIVGTGSDQARLQSLADQLGVSKRVHFAGQLSDADIAEAYATATVYVGLSRLDRAINVEGFGISFVEAAASGVTSVAGDSGGVRSAVRDGETGLIVDPGDAHAASAAIGRLLRDAELRERLARAARTAVESHYNWDRVASETREFVHDSVAAWSGKS